MTRIAPYVVGGLVAVAAMEFGPVVDQHLGVTPSIANTLTGSLSARAPIISKTDRANVPNRSSMALDVATVEVIGLGQPAIVYRHRDGRELFRTDPVDNVTVVTKGFVLPQVTVRRDAQSEVRPVPMQDVDAHRDGEIRKRELQRTRSAPPMENSTDSPKAIPPGCESSFSPVASPNMAHHMGRCMAENDGDGALRRTLAFVAG